MIIIASDVNLKKEDGEKKGGKCQPAGPKGLFCSVHIQRTVFVSKSFTLNRDNNAI